MWRKKTELRLKYQAQFGACDGFLMFSGGSLDVSDSFCWFSDDSWWFCGGFWWFQMVLWWFSDGLWRFLLVLWWFLMVLWWFSDGFWWFSGSFPLSSFPLSPYLNLCLNQWICLIICLPSFPARLLSLRHTMSFEINAVLLSNNTLPSSKVRSDAVFKKSAACDVLLAKSLPWLTSTSAASWLL